MSGVWAKYEWGTMLRCWEEFAAVLNLHVFPSCFHVVQLERCLLVLCSPGQFDTSSEFIRDVLLSRTAPVADLLDTAPAIARMLDQPLGAKLPVLREMVPVGAALTNSELLRYVETQPLGQLAASAHMLRLHVSYTLAGGHQSAGSEVMTTIKVSLLVDMTLALAASSLGLNYRIDRNTADHSGATGAWVVGTGVVVRCL